MSGSSNGNSTAVPFLDLITPSKELRGELAAIFERVMDTAGFVGGPLVEGFEREFAAFCEAQHCVGLASGTDAVRFALMAAGVQPGDAVVTVPNTFIATCEGISQAGAFSEFVDVDERTYNMDAAKLREFLDKGCRLVDGKLISLRSGRPVTAVVPIHLYGQMADMDSICELAEAYGLIVVEDACQAHGAEYFSRRHNRWMKAGTVGRAAAFSFYPGKNLGACGEAGAVTTQDANIAAHIRKLRDHGQARKYYHDIEGYNGRLDAIQAGFLSVKLRHLHEWNEQRRDHATGYNELFARPDAGITTPYEPEWSRAVYHLYVVRTPEREKLQAHLSSKNIGTAIHYPIPLHLQEAYKNLGYKEGDFPVSERVAREIVSLPMFPQLHPEQQQRVAEAVCEFAGMKSAAMVAS
jgi:dTDP-4-amino-4,6-dideoxygalactose transaminase